MIAPSDTKRSGNEARNAHRFRATTTCWLMATASTGTNIITPCTTESVTTQVGTGPPIRW